LLLLLVRYKYFLIVLIIIESIIMNVSIVNLYRGNLELGVIFIYYLVFRVCERVIALIILVLVIRSYYGDNYYNFFK